MKTASVFVLKLVFLGSTILFAALVFDTVLCLVGSLLSGVNFLILIRSDFSQTIMFFATLILGIAAMIRLAMIEEAKTRLEKLKELENQR